MHAAVTKNDNGESEKADFKKGKQALPKAEQKMA